MKQEIRIFFTALMFYTRIPCPSWVDHSPDYINKATRYFPFIGWIVGTISFLVYLITAYLLGNEIGVVISIMAGVMVTGAFHEDGLADVYDGFGGGWTKEKILEIMKDSRVGAYGVIALIFLFALKFLSLGNICSKMVSFSYFELGFIFLSYHALSRLTAINIVFTGKYSRADEDSKSKPIAKEHGIKEILGAYFFGLLPLIGLMTFQIEYGLVIIPLIVLFFYSKNYFNKWIDGYTGDCLGAVEQISEMVILLSFVAIWKFM